MTIRLAIINRLPSQDSMDRSVHNESSSVTGGGSVKRSAKQVIRELRQSNAAWSEKTAKMEAEFHGNVVTDDTGKRMVIVLDPDGNRIQLFEK